MAIMSEPEAALPPKPPTADQPPPRFVGLGDYAAEEDMPRVFARGVVFSFVYCPRCGAPLKLASVELRKAS